MRKFLLICVACVALSGCASMGPLPSSGANSEIAAVVQQVRAYAVRACSFLPTAETVANIFFSGNPALMTAEGIGNAICSAVSALSVRRGGAVRVPRVAGVVIRGRRV